jgi:hypothetical protein
MTLPRRLFIAALFASLSLPQGCIEAPSSGGGSGGGGSSLRCLFVTDAFADSRSRAADFRAIAAAGYNSVCALVDLQPGRPHVVPGRSKTHLTATAQARISECRAAGLKPIVMIRNDWADDRGKDFPSKKVGFYSSAYLEQEKAFVTNLAQDLGGGVGIQLSIEGTSAAAGQFNAALASHAADAGFSLILVNLLGAAAANWPGHPDAKTANSFHGLLKGRSCPWDIINTDGDRSITPANADAARNALNASGKGWILWADAHIHGGVHPAFLKPL